VKIGDFVGILGKEMEAWLENSWGFKSGCFLSEFQQK
jgi:hypothetical protein